MGQDEETNGLGSENLALYRSGQEKRHQSQTTHGAALTGSWWLLGYARFLAQGWLST